MFWNRKCSFKGSWSRLGACAESSIGIGKPLFESWIQLSRASLLALDRRFIGGCRTQKITNFKLAKNKCETVWKVRTCSSEINHLNSPWTAGLLCVLKRFASIPQSKEAPTAWCRSFHRVTRSKCQQATSRLLPLKQVSLRLQSGRIWQSLVKVWHRWKASVIGTNKKKLFQSLKWLSQSWSEA